MAIKLVFTLTEMSLMFKVQINIEQVMDADYGTCMEKHQEVKCRRIWRSVFYIF